MPTYFNLNIESCTVVRGVLGVAVYCNGSGEVIPVDAELTRFLHDNNATFSLPSPLPLRLEHFIASLAYREVGYYSENVADGVPTREPRTKNGSPISRGSSLPGDATCSVSTATARSGPTICKSRQ